MRSSWQPTRYTWQPKPSAGTTRSSKAARPARVKVGGVDLPEASSQASRLEAVEEAMEEPISSAPLSEGSDEGDQERLQEGVGETPTTAPLESPPLSSDEGSADGDGAGLQTSGGGASELSLAAVGTPPGLPEPAFAVPMMPPGLALPPGLAEVQVRVPSTSMLWVRLKGLPNELLSEHMMEATLKENGLSETVVKIRVEKGTPCGRALVCFSSARAALRCAAQFHGCRWDRSGTLVTTLAFEAGKEKTLLTGQSAKEIMAMDSAWSFLQPEGCEAFAQAPADDHAPPSEDWYGSDDPPCGSFGPASFPPRQSSVTLPVAEESYPAALACSLKTSGCVPPGTSELSLEAPVFQPMSSTNVVEEVASLQQHTAKAKVGETNTEPSTDTGESDGTDDQLERESLGAAMAMS